MENIDNIRLELLTKTKAFFDSIETQFIYREKHYRKYRFLNSFWAISIIFLVFNILPLVPYSMTQINNNPLTSKIVIYKYTIPMDLFFVRWIVFVAVSGLLFFVTNKIHSFFEKREDKYSLRSEHISFSFLYKAIKELDIYLINERIEHSQNAIDYIEKYLKRSFIHYTIRISDERREFFLPNLLSEIRDENKWVQFSDLTSKVLKSFSDFDTKISERIRQKKEIDTVIKLLNELLIYEYLLIEKVRVEKISSSDEDIRLLANPLLESFANKMEATDSIEKEEKIIQNKTSLNILAKILESITNLFTHQNILLMFISWLILLTILFVSLLYFGIKVYSLKIDTTIFIGAISGIVLGALTITATVYSKKK